MGRPAVRTADQPSGRPGRPQACLSFNTVAGRATAELAAALEPTELELFWCDDAHEQPGFGKGSAQAYQGPRERRRAQYGARLQHLAAAMNGHHDVDGALQRPAGPPGRAKTPPGRPVEVIDQEKRPPTCITAWRPPWRGSPFMIQEKSTFGSTFVAHSCTFGHIQAHSGNLGDPGLRVRPAKTNVFTLGWQTGWHIRRTHPYLL